MNTFRKNLSKSLLLTFFLALILVTGCTKEDTITPELTSNDIIIEEQPMTMLSKFSTSFGVTKITPQKENLNSVKLKISGINTRINNSNFNANGQILEFNKLDNNIYELKNKVSKSTIKIDRNSQKVYYFLNNKFVELNDNIVDNLSKEQNLDITYLVVIYNELTDRELSREEVVTDIATNAVNETCYFTSWSLRESRQFSEYMANEQAREFLSTHSDCHAIGTVDSSCAFGSNHICVASVTMECNGASCN